MSREIARRPPKAAKNRFDVALGSVSAGGPVHSRPVALVFALRSSATGNTSFHVFTRNGEIR
jgi:hypothetical protein